MLSVYARPHSALHRSLAYTATGLVALAAAGLLDCSSPTDSDQPPGPSPQYSVYLRGRVLDKDGRPIPNAIAQLKGKGLRAVTNVDGVYLIVDSTSAVGMHKGLAALDTVAILRDGQLISTLEVQRYVDTLPDVFVVQRDIYGAIDTTVTAFSRVEAVIWGGPITADNPKVVELWHNTATNGYSGFVYFVYTPDVTTYTVYVNVYGVDSTLIGRSRTVEFRSIAGNVQIPTIDPTNAMPRVNAGSDTLVSIRDTVRLHGTACDTFGGRVVLYEWRIGDGSWSRCATGDTVVAVPDSPQTLVCSLRVSDNDGNRAADAMTIRVARLGPVAFAGPDTMVARGREVRLRGTAADSMGTIVAYAWKLGAGQWYATSSPETTIVAPSTPQSYVCSLRVSDDDGFAAYAATVVKVVVGMPTAYAGEDAVVLPGDTIRLHGDSVDSCGEIVRWEWDIGGQGMFSARRDTLLTAFAGEGRLVCVLRVTDDDGNADTDTVFLTVRQSPRFALMLGYNDSDMCCDTQPGILRWQRADPWTVAVTPQGSSYWGDIECVGWNDPRPAEPRDSVLLAYPLTTSEESLFSRNDSSLSSFWASWAGRDSIAMTPPDHCHLWWCGLSGPEDAAVTVKAARGKRGIYLCAVVQDDFWYDMEWYTDRLVLLFDALPSDTVERADPPAFSPACTLSTTTTRELLVPMGASADAPVLFGRYEERFFGWIAESYAPAQLAALPGSGIFVEQVALGPTRRAVEMLIPWNLFAR